MRVIKGGFDEGMWLHDRNGYTDEEIKLWNERLRRLSLKHPWLKGFSWEIRPTQKPRKV